MFSLLRNLLIMHQEQSNKIGKIIKIALTIFVVSFLTLAYLGTVLVTEIIKTMSVICTIIYFAYFLLMPIYTKYESTKEVPKRL